MPVARWLKRQLAAIALLSVVFLALAGLPAVQARDEPGHSVGVGAAPGSAAQVQASDVIQRVVDLTNQQRASAGLPPLTVNSALNASALAHSQDMASHNFFSHTGSDGSSVDQRIRAAGYSPLWAWGENIAAGQPSPEEVVNAWMNSASHRANILSPYYREIGVAYVYAPGTTYLHYWTQDFASHGPAQEQPASPPPTTVPPTPAPRPTALPSPTPVRPTPTLPRPTRVPPTPTLQRPSPVPPTAMPTATPAPAISPPTALALARLWQVATLVNQERAARGLPPLALDRALTLAAQAHSMDMAKHGTLSHDGSDGTPFAQRAAALGYGAGQTLFETIAAGQPTAQAVVAAWMQDPRLRRRLLDPSLSSMGVGYAFDRRSPLRHYWTLDVAARGAAAGALESPAAADGPKWALDSWRSLCLFAVGKVG